MLKALLPLSALALLTGCVIVIADDSYDDRGDLQTEVRTLELSAADLDTLIAETGAGTLEIIGEAGRSNIELIADVHFADPDDIDLTLVRQGDNARLVSRMRRDSGRNGWARIDLVVRMPADMALDLEDNSGELDIRGLNSRILLKDGSGELRIRGASSVILEDGSGGLIVEDVSGDVFIEDGSGDIHVSNVGGTVTVDDGSGDINVNGAGGLDIIDDGSGDVDTRDIGRRVDR